MTALSQMVQMNPYQAADRLSVDKIWKRLPPSDRACACVIWAVLAPSPHNTQPWLWQVTPEAIELRADRSRLLKVNDPAGRKLVISCGCALQNLVVALRAFRIQHEVDALPDSGDPDLLARVRLTAGRGPKDPSAVALLPAIRQRRTNRFPFTHEVVPPEVLEKMAADAGQFGVKFTQVIDEARPAVAELVATADTEELADPLFRAELADWIRPKGTRRGDGMPADLLGVRGASAVLASMAVRRLKISERESHRDQMLIENAPTLVAVGSKTDTKSDWLSTGRALTMITSRLGRNNLAHCYLGQACEIPPLRAKLANVVHLKNPHMVIRAGRPTVKPHESPRRPVAEVLISDD